MATYKEIHGVKVQYRDSDATAIEGDVWYNSSTGKLRMYSALGSWASGGNLNTARTAHQSSGTGTDNAILGGGYSTSGTPTRVLTEQYNGTAWTEKGDLNSPRMFGGGAGTATAAIIVGGDPGGAQSETWNGTSWTETNDLNTARDSNAVIGTVPSALCIGGGNPGAVTNVESWNGTSWTETATDLNTAKKFAAGTGTVTACLIVATPATTEQFDGSSWTEIAESNTDHRSGGASGIVTDALFWGGDNPAYKADTETWDGTSWTEVNNLATARAYVGGTNNSSSGSTSSLAYGGSTPSQTVSTEAWTMAASVETVAFD